MAIRKEFWRLAWPAAAEGLLLMLLTAADLLMVSALGNTAVAAVSIFSQPRMVILCVTRSYSVALSAYVARRRGKHPDESLTSCSRASLMLGCGLSMLLLVGTWIGAGPLLRLAGAQDDYINLGLQYAFPTLVSLALSGPAIAEGRCQVIQGDVQELPFADDSFEQVTAFETIYFWPNLEEAFQQVFRVLKPGGSFLVCNESNGEDPKQEKWCDIIGGMTIYTGERLFELLWAAGFIQVEIHQREDRNWLCVTAQKP